MNPTASIAIKPKSSNGSNGGTTNLGRHSDNLPLEYVSPSRKASDHSISQLISCAPSNYSAILSTTMKHQAQSITQSVYDTPSSSHSLSNKGTQGSSSKPKSDSQHRIQSSSANGPNNNNFLHNNNNNNNSKHTSPRPPMDSSAFIDLCDTDEGETSSKKPKQHKHKHNKKSKEIVGNSIPLQSSVHLMNQLHQASTMNVNHPSGNDEVDHNQIIHDLKVNRSFLRKYFDLQL